MFQYFGSASYRPEPWPKDSSEKGESETVERTDHVMPKGKVLHGITMLIEVFMENYPEVLNILSASGIEPNSAENGQLYADALRNAADWFLLSMTK